MVVRWYHQIAAYLIILSAFTFWVFPQKTLLLEAILVAIIALSVLAIRNLPFKEDKPPT